MNIFGKTKIYKKEFNGRASYSTAVSHKNENGEYENMFVNVQMPKDINIENKTYINIKKGFISNYKDKNNALHIKLVVMEYEIDNKESQENQFNQVDVYDNWDNSYLPF